MDPIPVVGIGTVEIPVKPSFNIMRNDFFHNTLRLTTVLHAFSVICNILDGSILKDHGSLTGPPDGNWKGQITDREGRPVAYFDASRPLYQLKLRRRPPRDRKQSWHDSRFVIFVIPVNIFDLQAAAKGLPLTRLQARYLPTQESSVSWSHLRAFTGSVT